MRPFVHDYPCDRQLIWHSRATSFLSILAFSKSITMKGILKVNLANDERRYLILRLVVDHVDDFCASGCAVYCTCGLNQVGEHVSLVNSFIKKDSNKYLAYLFADTRVMPA